MSTRVQAASQQLGLKLVGRKFRFSGKGSINGGVAIVPHFE